MHVVSINQLAHRLVLAGHRILHCTAVNLSIHGGMLLTIVYIGTCSAAVVDVLQPTPVASWLPRFLYVAEAACPMRSLRTLICAQVLEHKLRSLDNFLLDAADRRRAKGFKTDAFGAPAGGAGAGPGLFGGFLEDGSNRLNAAAGAAMAGGAGGFGGFGGMGSGVGGVRGASGQAGPPTGAKRQRLMNAAMYEEQRNTAIRSAHRQFRHSTAFCLHHVKL